MAVRPVFEIDLNLTERTGDFACTCLVTEVLTPELIVEESPGHVVVAGDMDADPGSDSMRSGPVAVSDHDGEARIDERAVEPLLGDERSAGRRSPGQ